MLLILGAVVWHWWIAPILLVSGVGMVIKATINYLRKVSATRYPPKPKIPSEESS